MRECTALSISGADQRLSFLPGIVFSLNTIFEDNNVAAGDRFGHNLVSEKGINSGLNALFCSVLMLKIMARTAAIPRDNHESTVG
jgi:hypothetical protein